MTEILDIFLPALAVTAFAGNTIHVIYFMDHGPASSKKTGIEGMGDATQPPPYSKAVSRAGNEPTLALGAHVPEDSVLRRHYVTHLCSQLSELSPRPSESVLRRHHRQWIENCIERCLTDGGEVEKLDRAYRVRSAPVT